MSEGQGISYASISKTFNIAIDETHRFSTDSVLLSAFAKIKGKDRLLDLCTGCGIVAFCAFRGNVTSPSIAVAMDIQEDAVALMQHTVKLNELNNFVPILGDLTEIPEKGVAEYGKNFFDIVTCNPPYQTEDSGFVAEKGRGIQRHELFCSTEAICKAAKVALKYGGRFCLCQRPSRLVDIMVAMRSVDIEPKRLRFIQKTAKAAPWLFLLEGKVGAKSSLVIEPPLIMYDDEHNLNPEVSALYFGGI